MVKQPGHLTSMKKERGAGTRVCGCGGELSEGWMDGGMRRGGAHFEFVLASFGGGRRVQEIDGEDLLEEKRGRWLVGRW